VCRLSMPATESRSDAAADEGFVVVLVVVLVVEAVGSLKEKRQQGVVVWFDPLRFEEVE